MEKQRKKKKGREDEDEYWLASIAHVLHGLSFMLEGSEAQKTSAAEVKYCMVTWGMFPSGEKGLQEKREMNLLKNKRK